MWRKKERKKVSKKERKKERNEKKRKKSAYTRILNLIFDWLKWRNNQ